MNIIDFFGLARKKPGENKGKKIEKCMSSMFVYFVFITSLS
jgi:hypothetical protein